MSSLGQTLREAREAKGLSQSKVAADTRILVQIIADIENEDFHRIAAPIYGRGFVRLFAECVGLEPEPLVREYMDVISGRRPAPAPAAPVAPQHDDVPTPPPVAHDLPAVPPKVHTDIFGEPSVDLSFPPPPPTQAQQQMPPQQPRLQQQHSASPFLPPMREEGPNALERFRTGLSSVSNGVIGTVRGLPPSIWRKAALVVAAIAILALIVYGCVKLYQITTPPSNADDPVCEGGVCEFVPPAKKQPPAPVPAKLRSTGQKVPALYAD